MIGLGVFSGRRALSDQAGSLKGSEAQTDALTLQRLGSAANLNIHLHCLVLDGVYRTSSEVAPVFQEVAAQSMEVLHALLDMIISCLMRLLNRQALVTGNVSCNPRNSPDIDRIFEHCMKVANEGFGNTGVVQMKTNLDSFSRRSPRVTMLARMV